MPSNKHAAFRYRVLDQCFRRPRKWSMEELIEHVSEQLSDNFEPGKTVSERTLATDIALMRSAPPKGWNAPIDCENGHYGYTDRTFSIEKTGLTTKEVTAIREAVMVLRQFEGLPHIKALSAVLDRIEGQITYPDADIIQFETNPQVRGMEYLPVLYEAIAGQKALMVQYRPFGRPEPLVFVFHPYLLKEYRNRWFVFGWHQAEATIWNLPLDRIEAVTPSITPYRNNTDWDVAAHFRDIVGVTRYAHKVVQDVQFEAFGACSDYIETKPIHHTQKVVSRTDNSVIFSLRVIPNPELEAELCRWGKHVQLKSPTPGAPAAD